MFNNYNYIKDFYVKKKLFKIEIFFFQYFCTKIKIVLLLLNTMYNIKVI